MTFNPSPKPPVRTYSQPCRKCQGTLYRVTTGNVVDYRHAGGEFLCQQPQSPQQPKPTWSGVLANLFVTVTTEPSQADFALDA